MSNKPDTLSVQQATKIDPVKVRSPHILSMMEERAPFTYSARIQTIGEIAYQMAKIEHTAGRNHPLLDKVYEMKDGKQAKRFMTENLPFSPSQQKVKEEELRNVIKTLINCDPTFRDA